MGKKGKGTKKEDKPKKEVPQTAAKNKALKEARKAANSKPTAVRGVLSSSTCCGG